MADNNDVLKDAYVDEILDEVKQLNGKEENTKLWSLDEIDALLSDDADDLSYTSDSGVVNSYMERILSDAVSEEEPENDFSDSEPQIAEQADDEPEFDDNYIDEVPEPIADITDALPPKEETADDEKFDLQERLLPLDETPQVFAKKEEKITADDEDGLGLIEFARSRGKIDKGIESIADELEDSSDISVDEALKSFTDEDNSEDSNYEEEPVNVFDDTDKIEEITPLLDSTEISDEEEEEQNLQQEQQEEENVPGQISIEKTRLFNEVEARAVRSSAIDHHIGTKIIKTDPSAKGTMETDPYRERFLNKPELDIEKTQEHKEILSQLPPKTIERHGVIVKKSGMDKTGEDGLSPIPVLVDAADEFDAQQKLELESQAGALKSNELDNQIVLDGFNEDEEINLVNEAEEEAKLLKIRKDRASKFRLFPNLESDEQGTEETDDIDLQDEDEAEIDEDYESDEVSEETEDEQPKKIKRKEAVRVAREFFGPKDADAVYEILLKEKSNRKIKIVVDAVIFALMLVCAVPVSFFGSFALFADSPAVYVAINLLLIIICAAVNFGEIRESVELIKKKNVNASSAVTISMIFGALQCIVGFGFGDLVASGTHIYAAVAVFPVLLINIGAYVKAKNDVDNFVLLNEKQGEFYAVKQIDDESTAFEVGRGLMIKDPDIRYSAKVGFPSKFVEMTKRSQPSQTVFKLVLPVALAASVFVGIISGIINKNIFVGVSAMSGVMFMGLPSAVVLSASEILRKTNKQLNAKGGMISGFEAVEDIEYTNAVAVDAADMFENGGSSIYGMKLFNSMRIDEAILYTAAVVIAADGALKDVFDGIILNKREMLPPVDSLAYEERLGCSGWIYNYRVLVGNRDLLMKHNVNVQTKDEESKFTKGGRRVVYLAVEGKVAAMFVVGYKADAGIAAYLRELEKNGVGLLVRTSDANITEDLIEQHFRLPHNYVKVISPVAGLMFKEISEQEIPNEPCRILHNGDIRMLLRSVAAAFSIGEQLKISTILQYIGTGLGVLIMAMFSFLSGLSQIGVVQVLLFEAVWTLLVVLIPRIKNIRNE